VSVPQRHWDARAAANFMLGGAGSGLLVATAFVPATRPIAALLALALIAAGLGAVWLEIGRKLRAIHVFFNPFTSWMTRESFAAVLLFALGGAFLLFHHVILLYAAALAAAAFLYCQARILNAAKGIPAWRIPELVPLVVCTGLAEGGGLALVFSSADAALGLFLLALAARLVAWQRYRRAAGSTALKRADAALMWLGSIGPVALVVLTHSFPWAAPLAGVAALGAGWWIKFAIVTRASLKQDFSLPHLPVRGTR
jgi:phenylacetyl-CoA:acceptor oxidoreductase 26-kDa subunit